MRVGSGNGQTLVFRRTTSNLEEDKMKRKIVSLIAAVFAMAITCVAAFADTVTFDKKNKGKEKDFVTMEFNSVEDLSALCKKYPKNNAEVLIKAGSPFAELSFSPADKPEIFKLAECFSGAEFDLLALDKSGVKMSMSLSGMTIESDMLLEFKYDGKQYSLTKISGLEASTVSFLKVELNNNDYKDQNRIVNKLLSALDKQERNEFDSVKELETLCKKHKSDSFYIIIPTQSKIRSDKELEKLFKLISDGYSEGKNKFMSYFKLGVPVVIEAYVKESQGVNTNGDVLDFVFSLASSAKIHRDVYVFTKEDSFALKVQEAIFESERVVNEKNGLGKITNAEVEKERNANEAAGLGKLTNAEILAVERSANEKAGLGKLTNAEVAKERSQNEKAGRGRITNKQVEVERAANEKAGFGKVTNAEAEQERNQNEAAGLGRITNVEVLEAERSANEKAGLGKLTNAEVEKERKDNEAAGRGQITNKQVEQERIANEKAGLGKITNAEVEGERNANAAAGRGRITNAEFAKKLDEERKTNEKAGLGKLTNEEVEKERKANVAAGRGRLTNAEIRAKNKQLFMQKVPEWVANSEIVFAKVTIGDLFCNPKENTKVTINYTNDELRLYHEVIVKGVVGMKVDMTFKLAKIGDAGTCYLSRLYYESPLTFDSGLYTCYNPYNDAANYAEMLGALTEFLTLLYE